MKKLLFIAGILSAGFMSANTISNEVESQDTSKIINTNSNDKSVEELEDGTCSWCVSSGGNIHCAEASTCTEAKQLARAMALEESTAP